MEKLRINPGAVARTLLHNLDEWKPLSDSEERKLIFAIENSGINVDRMLAHISRNAIKELLDNI